VFPETDIYPPLSVFGLPPDIVGATLGDIGVVEVAGLEAKVVSFFPFAEKKYF
jgi:hypothetical protein